MNTSPAPFAIEPSSLAAVGRNLHWLLKAAFAAPAPALSDAAPAVTASPRSPLTAGEPDLWRLYRLAVVMDSVHPSIAAELERYRENEVPGSTTLQ
jgi:hypothetical protein